MSNQKAKEINSAKVYGAFIASGIATTATTVIAILTTVALNSENLLPLNVALTIAGVLWVATIATLSCRYLSRRMERAERRVMKRIAGLEDEVLTSVAGYPPRNLRSVR